MQVIRAGGSEAGGEEVESLSDEFKLLKDYKSQSTEDDELELA